jgi:hypothetical protein
MADIRPDLTLANEGVHRLAAMTGHIRMLSVADTRALVDAEELGEFIALFAVELKKLGTMLER